MVIDLAVLLHPVLWVCSLPSCLLPFFLPEFTSRYRIWSLPPGWLERNSTGEAAWLQWRWPCVVKCQNEWIGAGGGTQGYDTCLACWKSWFYSQYWKKKKQQMTQRSQKGLSEAWRKDCIFHQWISTHWSQQLSNLNMNHQEVVEHLPNMYRALVLMSSTVKKNHLEDLLKHRNT